MKEIKIGSKIVKEYSPPLIIAEVGANFNGDMDLAKKMITIAKKTGVDVVKFQSWTKETLLVGDLYKNKSAEIKVFGHNRQEDLLDFLSLTDKDHYELKKFCDNNDIMFASTPVSFQHVDMLANLDVPFFKIASMDLNHHSFLSYVAQKQKPVILSTGMGTIEEISRAVETIISTGNEELILLHCTALYPTDDQEVNLNNIEYLREVFGCQIGYSDHTLGYSIPLAAVAKGASVIEKHYTLDKSMEGWDHAVSATPEEFGTIVKESKRIIKALGSKKRIVGEKEYEKRTVFRRSVVAKNDLPEGKVLCFEDIDFKRPGTGIPTDEYEKIINRRLNRNLKTDELFKWEYFE